LKKISKRLATACFILLLLSIYGSTTFSKEKELDLFELMGARLYKVFETFGAPRDIFCSSDGRGEAILDYGIFGLQIANKMVDIVYFWETYPDEVMGVKIGNSVDIVVKALGKPSQEKKSTLENEPIYIYYFTKIDKILVIFFDDKLNVKRMQIEWIN